MTEPEDFPEEIWNAAAGCVPAYVSKKIIADIARAIIAAVEAERDACAKILDSERARVLSKQSGKDDGVDQYLRMIVVMFPEIAAVIRKRGEP